MDYRKFFCRQSCEIKRITESFLEGVNQKISFMCKSNNSIFIDNGNVSNFHLFDESLHLAKSGCCILANNVIDRSNKFLLTHLHHPNIYIHKMQCIIKALEEMCNVIIC